MIFFGYLDPGTGTIIMQALLGGAAGVAVLFKTMGHRFTRWKKPGAQADASAQFLDEGESKAEESSDPTQTPG